jgi:hypothetical protein
MSPQAKFVLTRLPPTKKSCVDEGDEKGISLCEWNCWLPGCIPLKIPVPGARIFPMSFFRALPASVAAAGLAALLFGLNACGGGNSSPPSAGYSLAATALDPASITAGDTSTSTITLTPASGYAGSVTLSCAAISGAIAPACSFTPILCPSVVAVRPRLRSLLPSTRREATTPSASSGRTTTTLRPVPRSFPDDSGSGWRLRVPQQKGPGYGSR